MWRPSNNRWMARQTVCAYMRHDNANAHFSRTTNEQQQKKVFSVFFLLLLLPWYPLFGVKCVLAAVSGSLCFIPLSPHTHIGMGYISPLLLFWIVGHWTCMTPAEYLDGAHRKIKQILQLDFFGICVAVKMCVWLGGEITILLLLLPMAIYIFFCLRTRNRNERCKYACSIDGLPWV